MSCCGKHATEKGIGIDTARKFVPTDECVFCAEKHLATAYALAQENFYEAKNRDRAIGELCLAQWHIYHLDMEIAKQMREMRHLIQMRKEKEIEWTPALNVMAALVEKELKG